MLLQAASEPGTPNGGGTAHSHSPMVCPGGGTRRFRTHALDHIRRKDDEEMSVAHPRQLQPLVVPNVHGPVDLLLLSPVPFASGTYRHSPRALSPVFINAADSTQGPTQQRPATAEKMQREREGLGREYMQHRPASQGENARRRLPPPADLDASLASVGSFAFPLSPRDVGAESVDDAIQTLEKGHAPKSMNLRESLDRSEVHAIQRLFEHLAVARSIQALNMSCNHFSDPMCWSLERLLEKNRSCLVLRLGNSRLTDKMCAGVMGALHRNAMSRVTEVYMGNNFAGTLAAESIAQALRPRQGGLQHLQVLNISHNRLGDAGGAMIIEALHSNVGLKTLDLGSNDLAFKSKSAFCKTLRSNRALREIRIERNPGLEDQGLLDILSALRFGMHSELVMIYTVEPLSMFCMDADLSGRDIKFWDNRTVIRFVRDVRSWYGDLSTALFPISSQIWTGIHKCIKRVNGVLLASALFGWHRACFAHAASRARRKRHDKQAIKRPYFNLWINMLTKRVEEPRFLERCRILHSKTVLLHITIWRLTRRHKKLFAAGLHQNSKKNASSWFTFFQNENFPKCHFPLRPALCFHQMLVHSGMQSVTAQLQDTFCVCGGQALL